MSAKSVTPGVTGEISRKAPLRGALVIGAATEAELIERLRLGTEGRRGRECTAAGCAG